MNFCFLLPAMIILALAGSPLEAKTMEEVDKELGRRLAEMNPEDQAETESLIEAIDQTPYAASDEYYKQIFIRYRDSKGAEATRTGQQRKEIFDKLARSCFSVDKSSNREKWGNAYWACSEFIRKFSNPAKDFHLDLYSEIRGLPYEIKKQRDN